MSKIDDLTRLRHMIDASKEAVVFLTGKSKADLLRDRTLLFNTLIYANSKCVTGIFSVLSGVFSPVATA